MDFLQIKNHSKVLNVFEKKCVNRVRQLSTIHGTYKMHYIADSDINTMLNDSDDYRMWWLAKHPNGIYIDYDCYIHTLPSGQYGRCWLPNHADRCDIFFIMVNGNTKFIRENFKPHKRGNFYGWPANELRRIRQEKKYNVIPSHYYDHKFSTLTKMNISNRVVKCQIVT